MAVGAGVTTPAIGDRVGVCWLNYTCGTCEFCVTGYENLCAQQQNTGFSVDGTLAQYTVATATHVIPLPANIPDDQAARKMYALFDMYSLCFSLLLMRKLLDEHIYYFFFSLCFFFIL